MATDYQIIYLEDIEEYLKYILEIVLKPSRHVLKKLNSLNDSKEVNKEKYQNHQDFTNENNELKFNDSKIKLYKEMDSLTASLNKNEVFYDEYFDFCEIQDITKDTLNREFSSIKNSDIEFIYKLVIDFSEIISFKIDLIENNNFDEEKFGLKYEEYLTRFNQSKKYYYENIYDEPIDDDLFSEYTKIIME